MLFAFWHTFSVNSFFAGREITYRALCVRYVEMWTSKQVAMAERSLAVLVVIDAALISILTSMIYMVLAGWRLE